MNNTDPFEAVALALAHATGLDPMTIVGFVPLLVLALNLLGRAIPDDKDGILGIIRTVAKIGGLYISNRVSTGVSANTVIKTVAGLKPIEDTPALIESMKADVPEMLDALDPPPAPLFPGIGRDKETGKFVKIDKPAALESPFWVTLVSLGLILYLSSCTVA